MSAMDRQRRGTTAVGRAGTNGRISPRREREKRVLLVPDQDASALQDEILDPSPERNRFIRRF